MSVTARSKIENARKIIKDNGGRKITGSYYDLGYLYKILSALGVDKP